MADGVDTHGVRRVSSANWVGFYVNYALVASASQDSNKQWHVYKIATPTNGYREPTEYFGPFNCRKEAEAVALMEART